MRTILGYCIILLGIALSSCSKEGLFKMAGEDQKETILLDTFNKLSVSSDFDLYLVQDSSNYAIVSGKSKMINNLKFENSNHNLTIKNHVSYQVLKGFTPVKIELHFVNLNQIGVTGNTNLYSIDTLFFNHLLIESRSNVCYWDLKINTEKLVFKVSASQGKFNVSGKANNTFLYAIGTSHLMCKHLQTNNATIDHRSIGDIHISVKYSLDAIFHDRGNIYCYKNPPLKKIKYGKFGKGEIFYQ